MNICKREFKYLSSVPVFRNRTRLTRSILNYYLYLYKYYSTIITKKTTTTESPSWLSLVGLGERSLVQVGNSIHLVSWPLPHYHPPETTPHTEIMRSLKVRRIWCEVRRGPGEDWLVMLISHDISPLERHFWRTIAKSSKWQLTSSPWARSDPPPPQKKAWLWTDTNDWFPESMTVDWH
jgi:hypothetical protein